MVGAPSQNLPPSVDRLIEGRAVAPRGAGEAAQGKVGLWAPERGLQPNSWEWPVVLKIGIDEAGYGPLLGPLVIGLSAVRVLDAEALRCTTSRPAVDPLRRALGHLLAPPTGRARKDSPLPVPVGDSKLLHARHGVPGLGRAFGLFAAGLDVASPADLEDLLRRHAEAEAHAFAGEPWFERLHEVPFPHHPFLGRLGDRFRAAGVELVDLRVWPVSVPAFNEIANSGSKARALALYGGCLLVALLDRCDDQHVEVVFDRHGGRKDYGAFLADLFPFAALRAVPTTGAETARYEVRLPGRLLDVAFRTKADLSHLVVSWASVAAKLTRELFMDALNRWFAARLPGLQPTAGYVKDGRRFLRDVEPLLLRDALPREALVRVK